MARQFDLVIYGDGIASLVAAWRSAKNGQRALHISRDCAGGDGLIAVESAHFATIFGKDAAADLGAAKVIENRFWFLSEGEGSQLSYRNAERAESPSQWLMPKKALEAWIKAKATEAGAAFDTTAKIEERMFDRSGRLQAIRLDGGELVRTSALILGDGGEHLVNDEIFSDDQPEMRSVLSLSQSLKLDADTLSARFCLDDGEGMSGSIVGNLVGGLPSRAWLKSDGKNLEIGLQVVAKAFSEDPEAKAKAALEALKTNPSLAMLLKGASAGGVQVASHTVTGFKYITNLYGNGWVLTGKSTRVADPMRVESSANEMQSGLFAAEAVKRAFGASDTSKRALGVYHQLLEDSFIVKNLKAQKHAVEELEKDPTLMSFYSDFFNRWFAHDTEASPEPRKERNKLFFKNLRNERPVWEFAMGMRKSLKLLRD